MESKNENIKILNELIENANSKQFDIKLNNKLLKEYVSNKLLNNIVSKTNDFKINSITDSNNSIIITKFELNFSSLIDQYIKTLESFRDYEEKQIPFLVKRDDEEDEDDIKKRNEIQQFLAILEKKYVLDISLCNKYTEETFGLLLVFDYNEYHENIDLIEEIQENLNELNMQSLRQNLKTFDKYEIFKTYVDAKMDVGYIYSLRVFNNNLEALKLFNQTVIECKDIADQYEIKQEYDKDFYDAINSVRFSNIYEV